MDTQQLINTLRQLEKHFEQLCSDAQAIVKAPPLGRVYSDFDRGCFEGRLQAYQHTYRTLKNHLDGLDRIQQNTGD
jgi:hypothetical protein